MWISGPIEGLENIFLLLQSTSSNDKRASLWMVKGQRVVCWDTLAQSNVIATSNEPGQATEKAEKDKAAHYQELCSSYIVMPVAMETMGAWGQQGLKFVKEIGERIATATGDKRATFFLFQAISMAVQRGNVASIAGSIPKSKSLDEPSYL